MTMKEKILIALNDVVLATALNERLKQLGYKTSIAQDGEEALGQMKSFLPDLVLIDLVLSGKNGYEVLNAKSFDRFITKIPVIILSNSGIALEMKRIPSTPTIKDFIVKTHIELDEVLQKIEKVFGKERQTSEPTSNHNKKVLWVEDDKLLSSILSKK